MDEFFGEMPEMGAMGGVEGMDMMDMMEDNLPPMVPVDMDMGALRAGGGLGDPVGGLMGGGDDFGNVFGGVGGAPGSGGGHRGAGNQGEGGHVSSLLDGDGHGIRYATPVSGLEDASVDAGASHIGRVSGVAVNVGSATDEMEFGQDAAVDEANVAAEIELVELRGLRSLIQAGGRYVLRILLPEPDDSDPTATKKRMNVRTLTTDVVGGTAVGMKEAFRIATSEAMLSLLLQHPLELLVIDVTHVNQGNNADRGRGARGRGPRGQLSHRGDGGDAATSPAAHDADDGEIVGRAVMHWTDLFDGECTLEKWVPVSSVVPNPPAGDGALHGGPRGGVGAGAAGALAGSVAPGGGQLGGIGQAGGLGLGGGAMERRGSAAVLPQPGLSPVGAGMTVGPLGAGFTASGMLEAVDPAGGHEKDLFVSRTSPRARLDAAAAASRRSIEVIGLQTAADSTLDDESVTSDVLVRVRLSRALVSSKDVAKTNLVTIALNEIDGLPAAWVSSELWKWFRLGVAVTVPMGANDTQEVIFRGGQLVTKQEGSGPSGRSRVVFGDLAQTFFLGKEAVTRLCAMCCEASAQGVPAGKKGRSESHEQLPEADAEQCFGARVFREFVREEGQGVPDLNAYFYSGIAELDVSELVVPGATRVRLNGNVVPDRKLAASSLNSTLTQFTLQTPVNASMSTAPIVTDKASRARAGTPRRSGRRSELSEVALGASALGASVAGGRMGPGRASGAGGLVAGAAQLNASSVAMQGAALPGAGAGGTTVGALCKALAVSKKETRIIESLFFPMKMKVHPIDAYEKGENDEYALADGVSGAASTPEQDGPGVRRRKDKDGQTDGGRHVVMHANVLLRRPLIDDEIVERARIKVSEIVPVRPPLPSLVAHSKVAESDFEAIVRAIVRTLASDFHELICDLGAGRGGNGDGRVSTVSDRDSCVSVSIDSAEYEASFEKIMAELMTSGKFYAFKEKLKLPIVKLAREKIMGIEVEQCDVETLTSGLFVDMVQRMQTCVNEMVRDGGVASDDVESIRDVSQLERYAREAEVVARVHRAYHYHRERLVYRVNDPEVWYDWAGMAMRIGDLDRARLALERCVEIDATFVKALFALGVHGLRKGDTERAEIFLCAGVQLGSEFDAVGNMEILDDDDLYDGILNKAAADQDNGDLSTYETSLRRRYNMMCGSLLVLLYDAQENAELSSDFLSHAQDLHEEEEQERDQSGFTKSVVPAEDGILYREGQVGVPNVGRSRHEIDNDGNFVMTGYGDDGHDDYDGYDEGYDDAAVSRLTLRTDDEKIASLSLDSMVGMLLGSTASGGRPPSSGLPAMGGNSTALYTRAGSGSSDSGPTTFPNVVNDAVAVATASTGNSGLGSMHDSPVSEQTVHEQVAEPQASLNELKRVVDVPSVWLKLVRHLLFLGASHLAEQALAREILVHHRRAVKAVAFYGSPEDAEKVRNRVRYNSITMYITKAQIALLRFDEGLREFDIHTGDRTELATTLTKHATAVLRALLVVKAAQPSIGVLFVLAGDILIRLGRLRPAIQAFKGALDRVPDERSVRCSTLRTVRIRQRTGHSRFGTSRGSLLHSVGVVGGRRSRQESRGSEPRGGDRASCILIAAAMDQVGVFPPLGPYYADLLGIDPVCMRSRVTTLMQVGLLQGRRRMWRPAREMYLQACAEGGSPLAWGAAGVSSLQLNQVLNAEQAFIEANIRDPHDADTWAYMSLVCLRAGNRTVESDQALEQAIKLGCENPTVLCELADRLTEDGRFDVARTCCLEGYVACRDALITQCGGGVCAVRVLRDLAPPLETVLKAVEDMGLMEGQLKIGWPLPMLLMWRVQAWDGWDGPVIRICRRG